MTTTAKTSAKKATTKAAAKKPAKASATRHAIPITPASIDGEPGVAMIPLAALHTAGINPRTTFDDDAMAELEASIAERGILQSLTVRRNDAGFEVVAGERRFRAVTALAASGAWDRDKPLPCLILEPDQADDAGALAAAIVENVQRSDLAPLDEAVAFDRLRQADAKRWTAAAIASAIGKTKRHVLLRLALVDKLDDAGKVALAAGKISLAAARALVLAPPPVQATVLEDILKAAGRDHSHDSVRWSIMRHLPTMRSAAFKRGDYKGELIGNGRDDDQVAADPEQFATLQAAAIEALKTKLEKKWSWVDVIDFTVEIKIGALYPGDYDVATNRAEAGAVITVDERGVRVIEDRARPVVDDDDGGAVTKAMTDQAKANGAAPVVIPSWPTKVNTAGVNRRKSAAMQAAVIAEPINGLRVAVFAMLGSGAEILISVDQGRRDDLELDPGVVAKAKAIAKKVKAVHLDLESRPILRSCRARAAGDWAIGDELELERLATWKALGKLKADALVELLGVLVATQVGTWNGYTPELGDHAVNLAIASDLKADAWANFNADALVAFMATARPFQLRRIARAGGIDMIDGKPLTSASARVLRTAIGNDAMAGILDVAAYKLPELAFGSSEALAPTCSNLGENLAQG
jgi:ParB family chromosome partitioning protein